MAKKHRTHKHPQQTPSVKVPAATIFVPEDQYVQTNVDAVMQGVRDMTGKPLDDVSGKAIVDKIQDMSKHLQINESIHVEDVCYLFGALGSSVDLHVRNNELFVGIQRVLATVVNSYVSFANKVKALSLELDEDGCIGYHEDDCDCSVCELIDDAQEVINENARAVADVVASRDNGEPCSDCGQVHAPMYGRPGVIVSEPEPDAGAN